MHFIHLLGSAHEKSDALLGPNSILSKLTQRSARKLLKINQHGFREPRIENCVHVVLKPKTIRPSKIKEVGSGANETILMKNSLLAYLFGYCMQCF